MNDRNIYVVKRQELILAGIAFIGSVLFLVVFFYYPLFTFHFLFPLLYLILAAGNLQKGMKRVREESMKWYKQYHFIYMFGWLSACIMQIAIFLPAPRLVLLKNIIVGTFGSGMLLLLGYATILFLFQRNARLHLSNNNSDTPQEQ